jgi:membrane protease YdiL (CAAX protease family)
MRYKLLWLGLITLIGFPVPSILILHFLEEKTYAEIFQLDNLRFLPIIQGISVGIIAGFLIYRITRLNVFNDIPLKVEEMILESKLTYMDALFLSFSAGFGEELLFRTGVQTYLGVILTSILFVAIHGYFSIKHPKISLYGLLVLPFILILGYGYIYLGLWFSIAAHFSYDLLLFLLILRKKGTFRVVE